MSTSLLNLIPSILQIEENLGRVYNNVANIQGQYNPRLKTAALVMNRQMKDHANYYRHLEKSLDPDQVLVDDQIISFMSDSLNTFKTRIKQLEIHDLEDFYDFATEVQKGSIEMMSLFKEQELPVRAQAILSELIAKQEQNMATLKAYTATKAPY